MWVFLAQRWLWRPSGLPDVPGLLGRPGLGGQLQVMIRWRFRGRVVPVFQTQGSCKQ
jgi:hypothetical protein